MPLNIEFSEMTNVQTRSPSRFHSTEDWALACGICPINTKGPSETEKTAATVAPSITNLYRGAGSLYETKSSEILRMHLSHMQNARSNI